MKKSKTVKKYQEDYITITIDTRKIGKKLPIRSKRSYEWGPLLEDKWFVEKFEKIKERDGYKCVLCDNKENLTPHFKEFYMKSVKPWNYEDEHILTYCKNCYNNRDRVNIELKAQTFFNKENYLDYCCNENEDYEIEIGGFKFINVMQCVKFCRIYLDSCEINSEITDEKMVYFFKCMFERHYCYDEITKDREIIKYTVELNVDYAKFRNMTVYLDNDEKIQPSLQKCIEKTNTKTPFYKLLKK